MASTALVTNGPQTIVPIETAEPVSQYVEVVEKEACHGMETSYNTGSIRQRRSTEYRFAGLAGGWDSLR